MRRVFVDAAAWIALINARDDLCERCVSAAARLENAAVAMVTTEFVLMEVADALAAPPLRRAAIDFLINLRQNPALEIVPATNDLLTEGWPLYCTRPDKGWGLTDCTSFAAMRTRGITQALTSDRHFEQAGFECLL